MRKKTGAAAWFLGSIFAVSLHAQPQSLRDAAQLDAEGKCDEAEKFYQVALARGAPSPALLNNAGNHYLVCGQPAKAQQYFDKLLQVNPAHPNANLQLARLATEQKQGKKALEYLARVKEADPVILLLRGEALHWAGEPAASAKVLEEADKAAQGDARLLYLLGLSCARIGRFDRAEAAFNSALALLPGNFDILFGLGRAAARAEHYDRAQRALEAAGKIRPDDLNVLVELGRVYAARQDYVRAVFILAQARQKAPGDPAVLLLLARAAEDAGYYDDSATAYDEYLRLRPDDDTARRDRARAYGQTESRREQARKEVAWYLGKYPQDPLGHYIAAQLVWWSEPEDALRHLSEAVRLDPNSVSIRFSRAWMLQRFGKMAESLPDLEVAHRLAPENARILDLIGLAHIALEQPAQAEKALRKALAQAPNDPEVMMHLGRALMALGREEEARSYLEKFQKIRPEKLPSHRRRFGVIELATLPAAEQRVREIERLRRQAREHPDHPPYQLQLSSLLLADGQKEEALREYRRLLGMNADSQVWEEAGSLLLSAGEYTLAREFLERAAPQRTSARLDLAIATFQLDGPLPALRFLDSIPAPELTADGLLIKASILEAAGENAKAEQTLNQGLSQGSVRPVVVQRAVVLLLRRDRKEDALKLLEQAIRANPQDSDLPLAKAVVLGLMDRFSAADKALREVELRWPEWDRAYLAHGLLFERAGQSAQARQRLQTAVALGSRDASAQCALARLAGAANPAAECACRTGLEQLLVSNCTPAQ